VFRGRGLVLAVGAVVVLPAVLSAAQLSFSTRRWVWIGFGSRVLALLLWWFWSSG
jgi:hypothetical protein